MLRICLFRDTIYFTPKARTEKKEKATTFRVIVKEDSIRYRYTHYFIDGGKIFSCPVIPVKTGNKLSAEFEDAIRDGHYLAYHESNGAVKEEGGYLNDVRVGEWRTYDRNQVITSKKIYSEGGKAFNFISYDKNGMKIAEGRKVPHDQFKGLWTQDGLWRVYYPNSENTREVLFYKVGMLDGPYGIFDKVTRKKLVKGQYKDGKRTGTWEWYDGETGIVRKTETFVNGLSHGDYITFHPSGAVSTRGVTRNNLREGTWKQYYADTTKLQGVLEYKNNIAKTVWYDSATGAKRTEGGLLGNTFHGKFKKYYIGTDKVKHTFEYDTGLLEGLNTTYDEDGNVVEKSTWKKGKKYGTMKLNYEYSDKRWFEADFENDTLQGKLVIYYRDGKNKRVSKYEKGKVTSEKCFSEIGEPVPCLPMSTDAFFEENLMTYIGNNLVYPEQAKEEKLQGKVIVSFTVEEDGSVTAAKIDKGFNEHCDAEALRIISEMPKWTPAQIDGHTFSQRRSVPILFWLDEEDTPTAPGNAGTD